MGAHDAERWRRGVANLDLDGARFHAPFAQVAAQCDARLFALGEFFGRIVVEVVAVVGSLRQRPPEATLHDAGHADAAIAVFLKAKLIEQRVVDALFGGVTGEFFDFLDLLGAHQRDRGVDHVAHHRFHVAAVVAGLAVLGGFHLDERCARQGCQAAGNLGLANAGRADQQDVLRVDIGGEFGPKLAAAPAVAQRYSDGAFGLLLADDVLVEAIGDLARSEVFGKVSHQGADSIAQRLPRARMAAYFPCSQTLVKLLKVLPS